MVLVRVEVRVRWWCVCHTWFYMVYIQAWSKIKMKIDIRAHSHFIDYLLWVRVKVTLKLRVRSLHRLSSVR